jgi:hypothetical protein
MHVRSNIFVLGALGSLQIGASWAQYQVNTQVNPQIYPSAPSSGSMMYSGQNPVQNPMLPSQARYAVVQSGMLPSELRGNAMAAGPLAPGGVAAIVPGGTPLSRATGAPAPPQSMSGPTGSIRYSQAPPPPAQDLRIGGPMSASPSFTAPISGSVSPGPR